MSWWFQVPECNKEDFKKTALSALGEAKVSQQAGGYALEQYNSGQPELVIDYATPAVESGKFGDKVKASLGGHFHSGTDSPNYFNITVNEVP